MMLRWFSVLILCCVAAPLFNTLRIAVNVAQVKTFNRRAASNRLRNDCDTWFVDFNAAAEIGATGELRVDGEPYDVVSFERVGGKLRIVAFKDDEEFELERSATKSSDNHRNLKSIAVAFQLFFEQRNAHLSNVIPIELKKSNFPFERCNTVDCARVQLPPPKVAA